MWDAIGKKLEPSSIGGEAIRKIRPLRKTIRNLCGEGAELEDDDPRKKYKYRVVFQGNRVVDQNMDEAQFQDMGSAPATIEASRMCIMKGLFKGNSLGQADAMQAYIQARLGGTETWVEIPEEGWPE